MSTIFGHQTDGFIYIDTLEPIPLAFYVARHPDYALPEGAIRREYMPGEYNVLTYFDGSLRDDGDDWPEGNTLLAAAEADAQAYLDSLPPPPPFDDGLTDEQRQAQQVETARSAALRALDDQRLADAAKAGNAPQEVTTYLALKAEVDAAVSATPVGVQQVKA